MDEAREQEQLVMHSGEAEQPFRYAVGRYGSKFFMELRDHKRLMGIRCPSCGKVYVPPRQVCGPCFARMDELVEVQPTGTLVAFTILRFSFLDPETGKQKPVPYGYGFIQLDGSDNAFQHFIEIIDEKKVRIGARMRAVFREKRQGSLADIKHFEILK
jgi:uncharacterized OB-fold protein